MAPFDDEEQLEDGWDDDVDHLEISNDIDVGIDDGLGDAGNSNNNNPATSSINVNGNIGADGGNDEDGADGWGDDDDIFSEEEDDDDDDDKNLDNIANTGGGSSNGVVDGGSGAQPQQPQQPSSHVHVAPPPPPSSSPFTDNDDIAFSSDAPPAPVNAPPRHPENTAATVSVDDSHVAPKPPVAKTAASNEDGGWDDDVDDLNFDDDWGDDDAGADREENCDDGDIHNGYVKQQTRASAAAAKSLQLRQELEQYVSSLHHMLSSINAVLEYEHNTQAKAEELIDYYSNRPALAEYTRSKELPRMEYQVVLPYGQGVETDKKQILAMNLLTDESLVARASNQSLLADLLQVLTGRDMLVRPQYLSVCVAQHCKFTIHLEEYDNVVDCQSKLYLSLPTETGRLDVAEVLVSVVFAPDQGTIQYRVQKIDVLLDDIGRLADVAQFITEMDVGHVHDDIQSYENHHQNLNQDASADLFRDAFLENSQKVFTQSTEGLSQALQQMDSVINIKSKLRTISNFIPDTDVIAAAEQEAMALAEARQREMEQQRQHHHYHQAAGAPLQAVLHHQPHNFPRPHPPPPPPPPAHKYQQAPTQQHGGEMVADQNRPKSLLGGFFKKLANSVALPDEDPSMYCPTTHHQSLSNNPLGDHSGAMPALYRRDETPEKIHTSDWPSSLVHTQSVTGPIIEDNQTQNYQSSVQQHTKHQKEDENVFGTSHEETTNETTTMGLAAIGASKQSEASTEPYAKRLIQPSAGSTAIAPDGWDEDMDDDVIDLDMSISASVSVAIPDVPPTEVSSPPEHFVETADESVVVVQETVSDRGPNLVIEMSYNKEDDIIETRKRWMNPRPRRPYIIE
jgi:hypothetical protein